jgi:hypothetical protein
MELAMVLKTQLSQLNSLDAMIKLAMPEFEV